MKYLESVEASRFSMQWTCPNAAHECIIKQDIVTQSRNIVYWGRALTIWVNRPKCSMAAISIELNGKLQSLKQSKVRTKIYCNFIGRNLIIRKKIT